MAGDRIMNDASARTPDGIWNSWGRVQYALEKQVFINKFQIPQFTREEPKWFSGLITLFLLVAPGSSPREHSLICA
jgi:hypothetical protein